MGEHSKGSPGPWTVNDAGDVLDSEGRLVAHLQDRAYRDGKYLRYYVDASDAALIAAAPELLALLREYMDVDMGTGIRPRAEALLTRLGAPGDGRR
jgi:hypothetical protein